MEEIWALQLHSKLSTSSPNCLSLISEKIISERLIQLSKEPFTMFPTVEEAFEISKKFNIPLHPKYSFYWDSVSINEVLLLKEKFAGQQRKQHQQQNVDINNDNNPIHSFFSCLTMIQS